MSFRRTRVAGTAVVAALVATFVVAALPGAGGGATDPADRVAAARAVDWLVTHQQADGGFELASFPGFETPDAVAAIAAQAQTGTAWSTAEARTAVEALAYGGPGGPTPIDALDDWVVGGINAGEAAKLLLLVVEPLGLDPARFGPSATDLAALVYPSGCGSLPATSSLFFYETMYVGLGGEVLCGAPAAAIVGAVRAAQRPEGGWNFNGSTAAVDPSDPFDANRPDVDTTAVAVQVLIAGGATWDDPAIRSALAYLAGQQSTTGAFPSFGSDDPNATAVAMLAVTAAGFDPTTPCWRDTVLPSAAGTPYAAPDAWIRSQQRADGRITSPNDDWGVNSFATSQSVEGLLRSWLPVARATGAPTCTVSPGGADGGTPSSVDPPADPVARVGWFTG